MAQKRWLLFILLIAVSGCKKGELAQEARPKALTILQQNVQNYSAQTLEIFTQAAVNISEIEPVHRLYFYLNPTCSGSPVGEVVAQALMNTGISLTLPNSGLSTVYFRTDTHALCYSAFNFTPQLDPVKPPVFSNTLPASPSRTVNTPAIQGQSFPRAGRVEFYTDSSCSSAAGSGTTNQFMNEGIVLSLPINTVSTIYGVTVDPRNKRSACTVLANYEHNSSLAQAVDFVSSTPHSPHKTVTTPILKMSIDASIKTVRLFSDPACSNLLAEDEASVADTPGLQITVPENTTTHVYSVGINQDDEPTACTFLTTYIHDNIAPGIPAYTAADPISPTRLTTLPKITGTAPADAALVRLYNSGTCNQSIGFSTRAAWSVDGATANITTNATTTIFARSEDAAGNTSACVHMTDYRHNNIAPAPPVFDHSIPTSPTNISSTPTFFGLAPIEAVNVYLYSNDTCTTLLASTTPANFENTGVVLNLTPNQETTIYGVSEDIEGNRSDCTAMTSFTHSDTPATPPIFAAAYPVSPTKTTHRPFISGTTTSTVTTVALSLENTCTTVAVSGSRGIYTTSGLQITLPLNATTAIYGKSHDIFGNESACQFLTNYTHTTIAPTNPTYTHTTPTSPSSTDFTPQIFGSVFANMASPLPPTKISFYDSEACVGKIGEGSPSDYNAVGITVNVPLNGITTIYARVFDDAANASDCTFMTNYTHNSLKPGRPVLGSLSQSTPSYTPQTQVSGTYAFSTDFMQRTSIEFYSDVDCTTAIANGAATDYVSPGIVINFTPNTVTPLSAASFNEIGNRSDCARLVDFRTYDTAPINLTIVPDLNGSLNTSWSPDLVASPAPTYALKRSLTPGGPYTTVYTGATSGYVDRQTTDGKSYYYVVQASNSSGQTVESSEAFGTVTPVAPSAGANLRAVPGSEQVDLSWTGFNQNMGYIVYRGLSEGGPYTEIPTRPSGATYTDTNLTNGTVYYYVVKGFNPAGKSIVSNEVRVIPLPLPSPVSTIWAVPQLSSPSCGGNPGLHIFWLTPPYYHSFRIHRQVIDYDANATNNTSVATFVDCSTINGHVNRFRVRAMWGGTFTEESPHVDFVAGATTLNVNPGDGYVNLTWSAPAGATTIEIFRSRYAQGPYEPYDTVGNSGSYDDNSVINGEGYFYYIQARDGVRVMGWPSQRLGGVPGAAPLGPTNLSLYVNDANGMELTWSAPLYYNQFAVYRASNAGGPWTLLTRTNNMNTTDVTAPTGMVYYHVRATWGTTTTAPSNVVSVRRANLANLIATPHADRIDLTWTAALGAQDYRVERATSSMGPFMTIGFPTANSYSDTGATSGQGYYYRVNARFADATEGQKSAQVPSIRSGATAPSGFHVIGTSTSSIAVRWVKINTAEYYNLYRSSDIGGPYDLAFTTANGNAVTYVYSGLNARMEYYFRIASVIGGTEYLSAPISGVTLAQPGAPMGIIDNNRVDLTWSAINGAVSYEIERSQDAINFVSIDSNIMTPFYSDTTAVNGQKYFYRIIAHFTLGSTVSPASAALTPGFTPGTPLGVSIMNNATGINASLSWIAVSGATSYKIYKSDNIGGPFVFATQSTANNNVYVTGLLQGQPVYFHVTALNGNMESAPSSVIGVIPDISPSAPIALYSAPNTITVSWNPAVVADSYDLYRSTDGFNFSPLATGLTTTTYVDSAVTSTSSYFYYYHPVVASGVSLAKSANSLGVSLEPIPLKPQAFTLSSPNLSTVKLDWESLPQVAYYEVYRSLTSGSGYDVVASVTAPTVTFTDTTITMGVTYYYTVRAFTSSAVPSPYADEKNIMVDNVPTGLSAGNNGTVIDLTWNSVPGASGYNVWRTTASGSGYSLVGTSGSNNFSDTTGVPNTTYYYAVSATFPGNIHSTLSDEAVVVKAGALSFEHPIELLDRGVSSKQNQTYRFERSRTSFNTNHYDGTVTYKFEFVATNSDFNPREVFLVDDVGTPLTSIYVGGSTAEPQRHVVTFTPPAGSQYWKIQLEGTPNPEDVKVYSARVVVHQVNASKARLYFPLLVSSDPPSNMDLEAPVTSTQQTSFSRSPASYTFRRQLQKFSQISLFNAWTLEALTARTNGAEGDFTLFNSTASQPVNRTVTQIRTDGVQLTRVQINDGETHFGVSNENNNYDFASRCRTACTLGTVNVYKAGLWLQVENLTKLQIHFRTSLGTPSISAGVFLEDQRFAAVWTDFTNPIVSWQAVVSSANGANLRLNRMGMNDMGILGGIPDAGSQLTFNSGSTHSLLRSGPLSLTSGERYIPDVDTSSPTQVHGSGVVIDVSF